MTASVAQWWAGLSLRERVLVGIAGTLTAIVIGWFGLYAPLDRTLGEARLAHAIAVERHGAVTTRVAIVQQLQSSGGGKPANTSSGATVTLVLAQAAAERGFTLSRNDAMGNDATAIAIANAKATALAPWLDDLAAQGLTIAEMTMRGNADGTVALTATVRRSAS